MNEPVRWEPPSAERLRRIARRLERHAWNQPGADKTWVLASGWQALLFRRAIRQARRVRSG
jgi:hypothetical protein